MGAGGAAIEADFAKYWSEAKVKIQQLYASLLDEAKRVNY